MYGHNDMLYKYYRNCSGILCMQICDALVASWITDDLQLCLIKMCQMLIVIIISDYNNCSPAHHTPGRSQYQ